MSHTIINRQLSTVLETTFSTNSASSAANSQKRGQDSFFFVAFPDKYFERANSTFQRPRDLPIAIDQKPAGLPPLVRRSSRPQLRADPPSH